MARSAFYDIGVDATTGRLVPTTRVEVFYAPPWLSTAAREVQAVIYNSETGTGTPGNPFIANTGKVEFWADQGSYDVVISDSAEPPAFPERTVRFDAIPLRDLALLSPQATQTAMFATSPPALNSRTVADLVIDYDKFSANLSTGIGFTAGSHVKFADKAIGPHEFMPLATTWAAGGGLQEVLATIPVAETTIIATAGQYGSSVFAPGKWIVMGELWVDTPVPADTRFTYRLKLGSTVWYTAQAGKATAGTNNSIIAPFMAMGTGITTPQTFTLTVQSDTGAVISQAITANMHIYQING